MRSLNFNIKVLLMLKVGVLLFCLLSTITNVVFWQGLAFERFGQILLGSFAIIFEIAKYVSSYLIFFQQVRIAPALPLFLVLVLLSVYGTISVLDSWNEKNYISSLEKNKQYQLILSQISSHEKMISNLQNSAEIDISNKYRSRAQKTFDKISQVQSELVKLRNEIDNVSLNKESINLKISYVMILVLGSMLEFTGNFLIYILGKAYAPVKKALKNKRIKTQDRCQNQRGKIKTQDRSRDQTKILNEPVDLQYHKIKQKIISKEIEPKSRAVRNYLGVSSQKACDLLKRLSCENVLLKDSRGYVLVS